mgnify:CR=1 FL=1
MRLATLVVLSTALAGSVIPSGAAHAANVTADPAQIAKVMRDAGYKAEIVRSEGEDPFIKSASNGQVFVVVFYGCRKGADCKTVQFYSGFTLDAKPVDLERINEWNANNRFGRAYRDDEGDVAIEMDVDLEDGGMSEELFKDNLEYWDAISGEFSASVFDWEPAAR